jgi:thioredoxin reductase (NADPH)
MQMSGNEFADRFLEQILAQGADIEIETVTGVTNGDGYKTVTTEEGASYEGRAVVIATGVKHRMLGLEGENELIGEGISFCAVCDGDFYAGKKVCVAGGGNSALQEAILLAEKCSEVVILQDLPVFTGEAKLQEVLFARDNVRSFTNVQIAALRQDENGFKGVTVRNRTDGTEQEIDCDGLFVAIGLIPENDAFKDLVQLNDWGYFDSDEQCLTKTPGIFVAGDCRSKQIRQLTTASADGAVAALAACRYINQQ